MRANPLRYSLLGAAAIGAIGLPRGSAHAEDSSASAPSNTAMQTQKLPGAASDQQSTTVGDIVVTARRRNESLVEVPISLTVVTTAKLEQLGLRSTTDIANYVPSLTFNSYTAGDGRNDAGPDRPIIMRGLNTGIGGQQGATLFLDGAAVIGNEVPASFDIGQVEVLRGPQSVYFGRATMTGAVSYKTRAIGDEWSGEFEGVVADQSERDIQATIAGPVIPGVLKLRITGLSDSYGGYVPNTFQGATQDLGATERNAISATAVFTPTRNLEIKGYVNYFRDNDGPAATAFVPASYDNCTFPGAGSATFCGEIPDKTHSFMYSNVSPPQSILNAIYDTPVIAGAGFKERIGTQREVLNSNLVVNWNVSSYLRFTSITGYHTNVDISADDGAERPTTAGPPVFNFQDYFYSYSTSRRDFSQEFRLSSDPAQKLSWTFGGNFIRQETIVSADASTIGYTPGYTFTYLQPIAPSFATTYGVFGGIYYKLNDRLSLAGEARYQSDTIKQTDGISELSATTTSFSPRLSLEYDIGGRRRIYASYAQGSEPAGFNVSIPETQNAYANSPLLPTINQQIQTLLGSTSASYREETLRIGELGVKGNIFDGKGFFDLNSYYGELDNEQVYENALIPALGYSVSATNNAGSATIYGIEWQGNYRVTHDLSIDTTFSWNHTERNQYLNVGGVNEFGTTDFNGKSFAYVPEIQGSVALSYTHPIAEGWDGYGNVAMFYRGKQYVDEYNAAYIPGRFQVDLRLGVQHGNYTLEAFCKNLFNDQNYTGGSVAPDYGTGQTYAFFGGWAPPRQFGLRILGKF